MADDRISKEAFESYIVSTIQNDRVIQSERLFLRLVELARDETDSLEFKGKVSVGERGDAEITIPVKSIMADGEDQDFGKIEGVLHNLAGKLIEYEDDRSYYATRILNDVYLDKVSGSIVIAINRHIWNAIMDFSKGFRRYGIDESVSLRGKYSLRIYKLISRQKEPITFSIAELRIMWGLTDKYKKANDFIKNTIVASKQELDRVSPYSFNYTLNSSKDSDMNKVKRGRPSITSVTFYPYLNLEKEPSDTVTP